MTTKYVYGVCEIEIFKIWYILLNIYYSFILLKKFLHIVLVFTKIKLILLLLKENAY
jgi:hypothetical protein